MPPLVPLLLILLGVLFAVCTTLLVLPALQKLAVRKGWLDQPDGERKTHKRPVPTIGGVAIAAGLAVGILYFAGVEHLLPFTVTLPSPLIWIGALLMVGVGLYDDTRGLGFKTKFALQIVAAYLVLHAGYRVDLSHLPFVEADPYQLALFSIPLTLLWVVGIINAVNLLDGLDGLAGGVVLIAFGCLALLFGLQGEVGLVLVGLCMVGALAGFLRYNFNPASIFMGDSGSLFIGFMLAVYTLQGSLHPDPMLALLVPLVLLGLPLLDTGLALIRRFLNRQALFAPDRDHIHHRLCERWSHRKAVLVLYGVALCFGLLAISLHFMLPALGLIMIGLLVVASYAGVYSLGYLRLRQAPRFATSLDVELGGDGVADIGVVLDILLKEEAPPVFVAEQEEEAVIEEERLI